MRILQRRSYRFTAQLILCVVALGITANLALNLHLHRLKNGTFVVHAHPYNSQAPFHQHSSSEVLILEGLMLLSQPTPPLTLVLIAHLSAVRTWATPVQHTGFVRSSIIPSRAPPALAA